LAPPPGWNSCAGLELLRRDQDRGDEAGGEQQHRHDRGGHRQQPAGTGDPPGQPFSGRAFAVCHLRHDQHAGLESGQAQGQLGEGDQRDADHRQRAGVLLG
jgi:hypothetical protein